MALVPLDSSQLVDEAEHDRLRQAVEALRPVAGQAEEVVPPAQRERLSPRAQAERHAARTAMRKQPLAPGWEERAEKTKSPGREGGWGWRGC